MDYKELERVNSEISFIDVKGKNYADVANRVKAFRKLFPNGGINTEIVSLDNGVCVMQTKCYDEEGKLLSSGTAYEKEGSSFINKTSYIENCETSSVGRALGFIGIGVENDIASVQEILNAEQQQVDAAYITKVMIKVLKDKCKNENVSEDAVLKIFKVDSFEKISNKAYYIVLNNWEKEIANIKQHQLDESYITKEMIESLKDKCKSENVSEEVVLKLCKVDSFEKMKNKVYNNVLNNWSKVLEECTKK